MSRNLDWSTLKNPVQPDGTVLCAWCKERPVSSPRSRFCKGHGCRTEALIRWSPAIAREKVFKRDRGICCQCGFNAHAYEQIRRHANSTVWEKHGTFADYVPEHLLIHERWLNLLGRWNLRWQIPHKYHTGWLHMWEMDHIHPVDEGGGGCGLDNLQTLCRMCHSKKTAEQRIRKNNIKRHTPKKWRQMELRDNHA